MGRYPNLSNIAKFGRDQGYSNAEMMALFFQNLHLIDMVEAIVLANYTMVWLKQRGDPMMYEIFKILRS